MKPLTKHLLITLFSISLALPAASIVLPVEPSEIDNQRLIPPDVSLQSLADPAFYKDALGYIKNANPVRALLIKAGTGLDYYLLDESPNPNEVLLGTSGWLYRRSLLETFCGRSPDQAVSNLGEFVRAVEDSGAKVVYTVAPPKFVTYPEHLTPAQARLAECGHVGSERLRAELSTERLEGYIDGWELFERLKASGLETHFRTDTHFNYQGSIPWMEAIISAIQPDLWDDDAVVDQGTVDFEGNLAALIVPGLTEKTQKVVVERGLSRVPIEQLHQRWSPTRTATERYLADDTASLALIDGDALVVGDSYMVLPAPSLVQYFSDITLTDWRTPDSLDHFLQGAHRVEVVIIEITAESVYEFFADGSLIAAFRNAR